MLPLKSVLLVCERRLSILALLAFVMVTSLLNSVWYVANVLVDGPQKRPPLSPRWECPEDAYNVSALGPHDFTTNINRSDFRFLLNSEPCRGSSLYLVAFVHSAPGHFHKRTAIRNTWGNASYLFSATGDAMRLVFLLGEVDDLSVQEAISHESSLYGDIVQGNFVDSYRNLSYKYVMGLKWVTYNCRSARYVLKTDDDVFIDLFQLGGYLKEVFGLFSPPNLMMCVLIRRPYVKRSQRSKWRVSFKEYRDNRYPSYCSGWGIVMSPDVVFNLYRASAKVSYFWVDDVLVTGILAKRIGLTHIDFSDHLASRSYDADKWLASTDKPYIMGYPDLDVEVTYRLWNRTKEYFKKYRQR